MKNKKINFQDFGALIALILLVVVIGIFSPEFRTPSNFLSLLRQSSINGLIAFGMTCVILTGGIDLSVGSVLALTTALCAGFISNGMPVGVAMILSLILGTAFGAISGFMVTKGRLQPFIATLITMTVFRGLTLIYMNGKPISNLGSSSSANGSNVRTGVACNVSNSFVIIYFPQYYFFKPSSFSPSCANIVFNTEMSAETSHASFWKRLSNNFSNATLSVSKVASISFFAV